jgi:hypothetical protein
MGWIQSVLRKEKKTTFRYVSGNSNPPGRDVQGWPNLIGSDKKSICHITLPHHLKTYRLGADGKSRF